MADEEVVEEENADEPKKKENKKEKKMEKREEKKKEKREEKKKEKNKGNKGNKGEKKDKGGGEEKSKSKLFIIIGVVVALGGGYFMFGSGGGSEETGVTTTTVVVEGVVIEGDQMTVVLADENTRYARITFGVVLPEGGDSAFISQKMPLLKDAALTIVSEYHADDLRGAAGIDTLRGALTVAALKIFTEGEVIRIILTEVLVQ